MHRSLDPTLSRLDPTFSRPDPSLSRLDPTFNTLDPTFSRLDPFRLRWSGGRIFSQRRMGSVSRVAITDVRVHDPLPTLNAWQIDESDGPPGGIPPIGSGSVGSGSVGSGSVGSGPVGFGSVGSGSVGSGSTGRSFHDVLFANITVASLSTVRVCPAWGVPCNCAPSCAAGPLPAGIPNLLLGGNGTAGDNITRVRFQNVTVGGHRLQDLSRVAAGWLNVSGSVSGVTVDGKPLT